MDEEDKQALVDLKELRTQELIEAKEYQRLKERILTRMLSKCKTAPRYMDTAFEV